MIQTILPFLVIIFTSLLTLLSYILKQAMSRGKFYGLYVHCKISLLSSIPSFFIVVFTYFDVIKKSSTIYKVGELIQTSIIFFILIISVYCLTVIYSIFTNYLKIKLLNVLKSKKTETLKIKKFEIDFGWMSYLVHFIVALSFGTILLIAVQYTKAGSYVVGNYGKEVSNTKNMVAFKFANHKELDGNKYYIAPSTIFSVNKQNRKADDENIISPAMPYHIVFAKGTHLILKKGTNVYYDKTQNFYFVGNFNKAISMETRGTLENKSEIILSNDTECVLADEEFSLYVQIVFMLIFVNVIFYFIFVELHLVVGKKAGEKQATLNE